MDWLKTIFSWLGKLLTGLFDRATAPADAKVVEYLQQEIKRTDDKWSKEFDRITKLRSDETLFLSRRVMECEKHHQEAEEKIRLLATHIAKIEGQNILMAEEVHHLQQMIVDVGGSKVVGQVIVNLKTGLIADADYKAGVVLGWPKEKLVKMPLSELVPARYQERHHNAFSAVAQGKTDIRKNPIDVECRTIREHEVLVSIRLTEPWMDHETGERLIGADVARR